MNDDPDDDDDVLAAEYVLGTLNDAESAALERRALGDAALASAIGRWQARLAPLADLVAEAPEPPGLWEALVPHLAGASPPVDRVPLSLPVPLPSANRLSQARRSLARWRLAAAVLLLLGLGAGGVAGWWSQRNATPRAVATLAAPGSTVPLAEVQVAASGRLSVHPLRPVPVPAGHSLAFWAWPLGAPAPTLLGAMSPEGATLAAPALAEGSQVMVTLEGPSGAAPGAPPGTTLFAGVVTAVPGS